jgi:hypothetical protein
VLRLENGKKRRITSKNRFFGFLGVVFLIDLKSVTLKNRVFYRAGSKIGFVQRSQDDVLAFFDSLTDWEFICAPEHKDPFERIAKHARCNSAP